MMLISVLFRDGEYHPIRGNKSESYLGLLIHE